MSRYGNLRAGPDATVTPEDLRCWRDLVQLSAMAAIGDPARPNPQLIRTARAAKNACAPGVVSRDNVFVRLSRLANRYVGETAAGRRELQDELAMTAEAARVVLEPAERRERKDIDG